MELTQVVGTNLETTSLYSYFLNQSRGIHAIPGWNNSVINSVVVCFFVRQSVNIGIKIL